MKKSTLGRLFLLAYKEEDVDMRIDLSLEAFWHHAKYADDVVRAIERARDEFSAMVVVPLLPIIHTQKLLSEIEEILRANPEEISRESFVSAVLHATDWVCGADCDAHTKQYFACLTEGADAPVSTPQTQENEDAHSHGEFGFFIEYQREKDLGPFVPLLYLFAAVEGMLNLYKERSEASELLDPRFRDRKLLKKPKKGPTR